MRHFSVSFNGITDFGIHFFFSIPRTEKIVWFQLSFDASDNAAKELFYFGGYHSVWHKTEPIYEFRMGNIYNVPKFITLGRQKWQRFLIKLKMKKRLSSYPRV